MKIAKTNVLKDDELALFRKIKAARTVANRTGIITHLEALCREFYDLRQSRGLRRLEHGNQYFRMDGRLVTIIEVKNDTRGYETVVASDRTVRRPHGIHRYNRSNSTSDLGRVTGTNHNFTDPRNIIAEAA